MARYGLLAAMHDFIDHTVLGKSSFAPSLVFLCALCVNALELGLSVVKNNRVSYVFW